MVADQVADALLCFVREHSAFGERPLAHKLILV